MVITSDHTPTWVGYSICHPGKQHLPITSVSQMAIPSAIVAITSATKHSNKKVWQ